MDVAKPAAKRRKLSPDLGRQRQDDQSEDFSADFSARASKWNLEQTYEKRGHKQKDEKKQQRLPIKTSSGSLQQAPVPSHDDEQSPVSDESLEEDTPTTEPSDTEKKDRKISSREEIFSAKEELARVASLINEDPEEHYGSLKTLTQITSSSNATVTRLGLATQLTVYKDIIPGYRIRALTEEEVKGKVSKEVRKQRAFEQSTVKGYQTYVRELKRISQLDVNTTNDKASLVDVAVGCACNLLEHVAHFNFREELLSIVVAKLSRKPSSSNFAKSITTLTKLFEHDESGNATLEAVAMLSKMIKGRKYRIHESVLNLFLHLRLLSEFFHKGSATGIDKNEEEVAPMGKKGKKQQREYRSKNERKVAKERKAIEKEMREADAVVSHEERDKNQAETLKLVFSVYFRILKERVPRLMGAVLEGLVKFSHLVNQDFFGDLLEALRELVQDMDQSRDDDELQNEQDEDDFDEFDDRDRARETLLCVITAFGLLQGQEVTKSASSLGLDLSFFIKHLCQNLLELAMNLDLETTSKTPQVDDPDSESTQPARANRVNVSTTIVLLLRSLRAALIPANARGVPPVRLAAFSKQLMTSSLQVPEKSSTAILGLLNDALKAHRGKINALWNTEERKGDGAFNALHGDVEGSNPFATTVWEGELLQKHFSPQVREGLDSLYTQLNKT